MSFLRVKIPVVSDFLIKKLVSYTIKLQNMDFCPILSKKGDFRVTKSFTFPLCTPTDPLVYIDMSLSIIYALDYSHTF